LFKQFEKMFKQFFLFIVFAKSDYAIRFYGKEDFIVIIFLLRTFLTSKKRFKNSDFCYYIYCFILLFSNMSLEPSMAELFSCFCFLSFIYFTFFTFCFFVCLLFFFFCFFFFFYFFLFFFLFCSITFFFFALS